MRALLEHQARQAYRRYLFVSASLKPEHYLRFFFVVNPLKAKPGARNSIIFPKSPPKAPTLISIPTHMLVKKKKRRGSLKLKIRLRGESLQTLCSGGVNHSTSELSQTNENFLLIQVQTAGAHICVEAPALACNLLWETLACACMSNHITLTSSSCQKAALKSSPAAVWMSNVVG